MLRCRRLLIICCCGFPSDAFYCGVVVHDVFDIFVTEQYIIDGIPSGTWISSVGCYIFPMTFVIFVLGRKGYKHGLFKATLHVFHVLA